MRGGAAGAQEWEALGAAYQALGRLTAALKARPLWHPKCGHPFLGFVIVLSAGIKETNSLVAPHSIKHAAPFCIPR